MTNGLTQAVRERSSGRAYKNRTTQSGHRVRCKKNQNPLPTLGGLIGALKSLAHDRCSVTDNVDKTVRNDHLLQEAVLACIPRAPLVSRSPVLTANPCHTVDDSLL